PAGGRGDDQAKLADIAALPALLPVFTLLILNSNLVGVLPTRHVAESIVTAPTPSTSTWRGSNTYRSRSPLAVGIVPVLLSFSGTGRLFNAGGGVYNPAAPKALQAESNSALLINILFFIARQGGAGDGIGSPPSSHKKNFKKTTKKFQKNPTSLNLNFNFTKIISYFKQRLPYTHPLKFKKIVIIVVRNGCCL
ncbi:MAG: hypothetical protein NZZ41_02205, partial [Candidatus Dojkabacteria bacterium]|nr:hypothetical protein [Candidatus Dojkabacteria bacterium]